MHSPFPWTTHSHTPTAVFDADGKRIVDQWVAPDSWLPIETAPDNHFVILVDGPYGALTAFRDVNWDWWPFPAVEALEYRPTRWMHLPSRSDKPAPTPLDPETAAANAALIAAIPALIEVLDGIAKQATSAEMQASVDADCAKSEYAAQWHASAELADFRGGYDECVVRVRAVLASIGRVK